MYILYVFFQSQTFYIFMSHMKQYFFFLLRNKVLNCNRNQVTTNTQLPRSPSLLAELATGLLCSPLLFSVQLLCLILAFGGLTAYLSSHCLHQTLWFWPLDESFLYQLQFSPDSQHLSQDLVFVSTLQGNPATYYFFSN